MTAKQALLAHIVAEHPGLAERTRGRSLAQLVRLHGEYHHRHASDSRHRHATEVGWRTGAEMIRRSGLR